jgi:hypothetical protein
MNHVNHVLEVIEVLYIVVSNVGKWYCCQIVRRMSVLCLYINVDYMNDFLVDSAAPCGCNVGIQFQMLDYGCLWMFH